MKILSVDVYQSLLFKDHISRICKFHETRAAMTLVVSKFNSVKFGKRSFSYEGVFLWNNLENTFKLSKYVKLVKGQILRWNGPLCHCQTCILCQLNDFLNFIMRGLSTVLERVKSSYVLRNIFL